MKRLFVVITLLFGAVASVSAQTEKDLKKFFEGKQVKSRIDLPNTKDGVNIYPERAQSFDYEEYAGRVKQRGVVTQRDGIAVISRVRVKDRHIEVQVRPVGANTMIDGSRFNVHFERIDSLVLTPQVLVEALTRYVEFSPEDVASLNDVNQPYVMASYKKARVIKVGESSTYLKKGLSSGEVISLLGTPVAVYSKSESGTTVKTYEFKRSGAKVIVAEFVNNELVDSRTEFRAKETGLEGS